MREKEKGDWKKLSIEDKKQLYRASFRQTFAEIEAPTGEWKSTIGLTLVGISISLWLFIWIKNNGNILKFKCYAKLIVMNKNNNLIFKLF